MVLKLLSFEKDEKTNLLFNFTLIATKQRIEFIATWQQFQNVMSKAIKLLKIIRLIFVYKLLKSHRKGPRQSTSRIGMVKERDSEH